MINLKDTIDIMGMSKDQLEYVKEVLETRLKIVSERIDRVATDKYHCDICPLNKYGTCKFCRKGINEEGMTCYKDTILEKPKEPITTHVLFEHYIRCYKRIKSKNLYCKKSLKGIKVNLYGHKFYVTKDQLDKLFYYHFINQVKLDREDIDTKVFPVVEYFMVTGQLIDLLLIDKELTSLKGC